MLVGKLLACGCLMKGAHSHPEIVWQIGTKGHSPRAHVLSLLLSESANDSMSNKSHFGGVWE